MPFAFSVCAASAGSSNRTSQLLAIFMLASSLFMIGCASESDDSGARIVPDKLYDKAQCKTQPDAGEEAIFSNASRDEIVTSRYFGKKYDRADLDAVLNASAISAGEYLKQIGVEVFHVPRATGAVCPMYIFLPTPPDDIRAIWEDTLNGAPPNSTLAGLYTDYCYYNCDERKVNRPVILLDEHSDRWTIVHELMHYNYDKERRADLDYPTRTRLITTHNNSMARIKEAGARYDNSGSRWDLDEVASELDRLANVKYRLLIQRDFEEIALESLLLDEWSAGRLNYVSDASAESAAWYIKHSREQGLKHLTIVSEDLNFVIEEAAPSKRDWPEIFEKAYATRKFIRDIEHATLEILTQAERKVRRLGDVQLLTTSVRPLEEINPRAAAKLRHHLEHLEGTRGFEGFNQKPKRLLKSFERSERVEQ